LIAYNAVGSDLSLLESPIMVKVEKLTVGTTYLLYLKDGKQWTADWNGENFQNEGVAIPVDRVDFVGGPVEMRTHTFTLTNGHTTSYDCLSVCIDGQWVQIGDSTNA